MGLFGELVKSCHFYTFQLIFFCHIQNNENEIWPQFLFNMISYWPRRDCVGHHKVSSHSFSYITTIFLSLKHGHTYINIFSLWFHSQKCPCIHHHTICHILPLKIELFLTYMSTVYMRLFLTHSVIHWLAECQGYTWFSGRAKFGGFFNFDDYKSQYNNIIHPAWIYIIYLT